MELYMDLLHLPCKKKKICHVNILEKTFFYLWICIRITWTTIQCKTHTHSNKRRTKRRRSIILKSLVYEDNYGSSSHSNKRRTKLTDTDEYNCFPNEILFFNFRKLY